MIRATKQVQTDVCPTCNETILVTNWDDMEGIEVSPYRVDPTPIDQAQETVCIVIGRATYVLEETSVRTWRLSKRGPHMMRHPESPYPVAIVPHHKCGGRHPGEMTMPTPYTHPLNNVPF